MTRLTAIPNVFESFMPRLFAFLTLFLAAPLHATEVKPADDVRPLLRTYCLKCHGADKAEGGVNYAPLLASADAALSKPRLWKRAHRRVVADEMPPEGAKLPTDTERKRLVAWMTAASGYLDCDPTRRDPGPNPLRRLTRAEYENTLRDLFGLHFDAGSEAGLPADPITDGHFDTLAANLTTSPTLMEKYFTAAGRITEAIFNDNRGVDRRRIFVARPGDKVTDTEAAAKVATRLLRRAYRRPVREEDVKRLVGFHDRARAKGGSFEDGVRAMLQPMLVSPQFLLRLEEERPASGKSPGVAVDDHELAVRLSYFLWSSMPDDKLFELADAGKLSDPAELEKQVRRMLADEKAKALTERFAVQWLQLHKLPTARPTTEFFPTFDSGMKRAMREEATAFFDHLRTADRSVLELLDADYTFANEQLAKHYGIAGVTGNKPVKVALKPEHHRGGVLGMGGVLALTSHTFRTSPTQRGKYVLEVIFGTPPPPPPANAGTLKEEAPKKGKPQPLTFKEQLARHASEPSCAACHRRIDPLGFALDNYNAVGAWRESTKEMPLDVAGVLPTGEKVQGAADLKRVILSRKDEFARNMAAKLLEYALGRELDGPDECTIREVHAAMQKNGYKFSVLVTEIVKSVPFRQRRARGTP